MPTETTAPCILLEGSLPPALDGLFARIGPNPALPPTGGYHWFDGDGMVHAVRISGGRATYANRWVDTERLRAERAAGHPLYAKFGDYRGVFALGHMALQGLRAAVGLLPPKTGGGVAGTSKASGKVGGGTANTALVFHARKLLALHEGDLPHALRVACDGAVSTAGRVLVGEVGHPFTAHPKTDPDDGSLHAIGYRLDAAPYLFYMHVSAEGALLRDVPIATPDPTMQHDVGMAGDWIVFIDPPLIFKPEAMVGSLASMPFVYDTARPLRIGLLAKGAPKGDDTIWFELPPCMIFHVANAWVDPSTPSIVRLFACCFDTFSLDLEDAPATGAAFDGFAKLCEIELDLASGHASRRVVSPVSGDFPVVPANKVGKQARYAYVATIDRESPVPLFTGVAKMDLGSRDPATAIVASAAHGPGRHGGEVAFVPDPARAGKEDGGFLVTYVHPEGGETSEVVVYDAATMARVARVGLPARVPFGFHVAHVAEAALAGQE